MANISLNQQLKHHHIKKQDLAHQLGISRTTLWRWLNKYCPEYAEIAIQAIINQKEQK